MYPAGPEPCWFRAGGAWALGIGLDLTRHSPRCFKKGGSDPEHALPIETSVRHQDMAVGIEAEEVAKGLDGAMTAPGMGFLSGTVSRRKSFRDSQAQRLRSERRSRS